MVKPTADDLRISGGLIDSFTLCDPCISNEAYNRLRSHELAEKETSILLGQPGGSVDGVIERGSVVSGRQSKQAEARKAQKRWTAQAMELVEQICADIERMQAEADALEALFDARDEAWREKLALEILDEDETPQRRPGESMEDYRERLEKRLIEEMLNPDGTIKDKYKNDPRYRDYAEWAQKQYHLNKAQSAVAELENPDTTSERITEILNEMRERGSTEQNTFAARAATDQDARHQIKNIDDVNRDAALQTDQTSELSGFLQPKS